MHWNAAQIRFGLRPEQRHTPFRAVAAQWKFLPYSGQFQTRAGSVAVADPLAPIQAERAVQIALDVGAPGAQCLRLAIGDTDGSIMTAAADANQQIGIAALN